MRASSEHSPSDPLLGNRILIFSPLPARLSWLLPSPTGNGPLQCLYVFLLLCFHMRCSIFHSSSPLHHQPSLLTTAPLSIQGSQSEPTTSILTLVFPNAGKNILPDITDMTSNTSASVISTSSQNPLTSHGSVITIAVPYDDAANYLNSVQQLAPATVDGHLRSEKWIMENVRPGLGFSGNVIQSIESAWYSFLNVLMVCELSLSYLSDSSPSFSWDFRARANDSDFATYRKLKPLIS